MNLEQYSALKKQSNTNNRLEGVGEPTLSNPLYDTSSSSIDDRIKENSKRLVDRDLNQNTNYQPVKKDLNVLGEDIDKYKKYGIGVNPAKDDYESLKQQRANNQSNVAKLANGVARAIVNEGLIGIPLAASDFLDFVIGRLMLGNKDFSNPVSDILEKAQKDFEEITPIYRRTNFKMASGAMSDVGWWAENLPSIASSIGMAVPSGFAVKGIGNLVQKGRAVKRAKKINAIREAKAADTLKDIDVVTRDAAMVPINSSMVNKMTRKFTGESETAQRLATSSWSPRKQQVLDEGLKIFGTAAISRTMENYQEARQVYSDVYELTKNELNNLSEEDYNDFIKRNPEYSDLDKDSIAKDIAEKSSDKTFKLDYINTIFDVMQLFALKNIWKGFKNGSSTARLNATMREALDIIGKGGTVDDLAKIGKGLKHHLRVFADSSVRGIASELSEGVEEAVNYIAQEEGMYYGKHLLTGEVSKNRLNDYLASPELWESAFWGVLGGVTFQAVGSQAGYVKNVIKNAEKSNDDFFTRLKSGTNAQDELRRVNIIDTAKRFLEISNDFKVIDSGKHPFYNDVELTTDEEKETIKKELFDSFLTDVTLSSGRNGNLKLLKAFVQDSNLKQGLIDTIGYDEETANELVSESIAKIDKIEKLYDKHYALLDNRGFEPIIAQTIAARNVKATINAERYQTAINDQINYINEQAGEKFTQAEQDLIRAYTLIGVIRGLQEENAKLEKQNTLSAKRSIDGNNKTIQYFLDSLNIIFNSTSNLDFNQEMEEKDINKVIEKYKNSNAFKNVEELGRYFTLADYVRYDTLLKHTINEETKEESNDNTPESEKYLDDFIEKTIGEQSDDVKVAYRKSIYNVIKIYGKRFVDLINGTKVTVDQNIDSTDILPNNRTLFNAYRELANLQNHKLYEESKIAVNDKDIANAADDMGILITDARRAEIERSFDDIQSLMKKYSSDEVYAYINNADENNKPEIKDITEEDLNVLNNAITILDYFQSPKSYVINRFMTSKLTADYEKVKEENREKENNITPVEESKENVEEKPEEKSQGDSPSTTNSPVRGSTMTPSTPSTDNFQVDSEGFTRIERETAAQIGTNPDEEFTLAERQAAQDSLNTNPAPLNAHTFIMEALLKRRQNGKYERVSKEEAESLRNDTIEHLNKLTKTNNEGEAANIDSIIVNYDNQYNKLFNKGSFQSAISGLSALASLQDLIEKRNSSISENIINGTVKGFVDKYLNELSIEQTVVNGKSVLYFSSLARFIYNSVNDEATSIDVINYLIRFFKLNNDYNVLDRNILDDSAKDRLLDFIRNSEKEVITDDTSFRINIRRDENLSQKTINAIDELLPNDTVDVSIDRSAGRNHVVFKKYGTIIGDIPIWGSTGLNQYRIEAGGLVYYLDSNVANNPILQLYVQWFSGKDANGNPAYQDLNKLLAVASFDEDANNRDGAKTVLKSNPDFLKLAPYVNNKKQDIDKVVNHVISLYKYYYKNVDIFSSPKHGNERAATVYNYFKELYNGADFAIKLKNGDKVIIDKVSEGEINKLASNKQVPVSVGVEKRIQPKLKLGVVSTDGKMYFGTFTRPNFVGAKSNSFVLLFPNRAGERFDDYAFAFPNTTADSGIDTQSDEFKKFKADVKSAVKNKIKEIFNSDIADREKINILYDYLYSIYGNTDANGEYSIFRGNYRKGYDNNALAIGTNPDREWISITLPGKTETITKEGDVTETYTEVVQKQLFIYADGSYNYKSNSKNSNNDVDVNYDIIDATDDNKFNKPQNVESFEKLLDEALNSVDIALSMGLINHQGVNYENGIISMTNDSFKLELDDIKIEADSYLDFLIKNNLITSNVAKIDSGVDKGRNYRRVSPYGNQKTNQVVRVKEYNRENISQEYALQVIEERNEPINRLKENGESSVTDFITPIFGKSQDIIKVLFKTINGVSILPNTIYYNPEIDNHKLHDEDVVYSEYNTKTDTISVGDNFLNHYLTNPKDAIQRLIHEQVHRIIHQNPNNEITADDLYNSIEEVYNEFKDVIEKDKDIIGEAQYDLFKRILREDLDRETRLEEFLVDSFTLEDLTKYLAKKETTSPVDKTKSKTLLQKIFDVILSFMRKIHNFRVKSNSLLAKELNIIGNRLKTDNSTNNNLEQQINENDVQSDRELSISEVEELSVDKTIETNEIENSIESKEDINDLFDAMDDDIASNEDDNIMTDEVGRPITYQSAIVGIQQLSDFSDIVSKLNPDELSKFDSLLDAGTLQIACKM